jgi:hypothetical protein
VSATVYLPHPEPGPSITGARVARHHVGFTDREIEDHVPQRLAGRGSPLVAAVIAAGGRVTVERACPDADRNLERAHKRRHEAPRPCPRCVGPAHTSSAACRSDTRQPRRQSPDPKAPRRER